VQADTLHNWQKKSKEKQKGFRSFLSRANKNAVLKQLPQLHEEAFEKLIACNALPAAKIIRPVLKQLMSSASASIWDKKKACLLKPTCG
jgi:hypothetical protein